MAYTVHIRHRSPRSVQHAQYIMQHCLLCTAPRRAALHWTALHCCDMYLRKTTTLSRVCRVRGGRDGSSRAQLRTTERRLRSRRTTHRRRTCLTCSRCSNRTAASRTAPIGSRSSVPRQTLRVAAAEHRAVNHAPRRRRLAQVRRGTAGARRTLTVNSPAAGPRRGPQFATVTASCC